LPPVGWGTPEIQISGFVSPGTASTFGDIDGPYTNTNRVYQVIDNFSWTAGSHALRMGGELRWDQYNQFGNLFLRGQFRFEPNVTTRLTNGTTGAAVPGTGNAFAEYLLGYGRRNQGSVVPAEIKFRATSQAYYIDDTWKIHPRVSINFGLRYEYTPPFLDKTGTLINFHVPYVDTTPNVTDMSRHPTLVREGTGDFYDGLLVRF